MRFEGKQNNEFWGLSMRRVPFVAVLLCLFFAAGNVFGQASQVGGIVQDPSKALIPGVTITLTNNGTGVASTQVSNEAGAYTFPSVQPGTYKLTATLPGFKTSVVNELAVGTTTQVRWDFTLQVGELASQVEVSVNAQQLLTQASASIGEVLSEQRVRDLPLVNGDILELVRIMPGVRPGLAGDTNTTFAGLGVGSMNTVRDGLSVSDTRSNTGLFATTTINPDLVGEIRIILAPVDAEQGRGNGQIQIQTRSGTNKYTGSAVWIVRNSALNANLWDNNRDIDPVTGRWSPTPLDWRNTHQYTVSYGGPIVRNKTFFFALWDHNISNTRTLQTNTVLTDTARQGIFRYFTGWNSGNARTPIPTFPASATAGIYPVVDFAGNPVAPPRNPDGSPYTGGLRCYSVFGNVKADGSPFTTADCPGGTAIITSGKWDSLRPTMDPTGYIRRIIDAMPRANYWSAGGTTIDGLNLAQFQWLRGRKGATGAGAQSGTSPELVNRKQINIKIDEHFTAKHRLSVGWSYQADDSAENVANWPGGLNGDSRRRPQVLTLNFTSTLTPSILNEARTGITYGRNEVNPPWDSSDSTISEAAKALLLSGGTNSRNGATYPVAFTPGAGNFAFGNHLINTGSTLSGHTSPLYNFADTLSWTRGQHSFRMGAELRLTRSNGYSGNVLPTASGGAGGNTSALSNAIAALPGQLTATRTNAANMLYLLSGSVNTASMLYWIDSDEDVKNGEWQDYATAGRRYRKQVANEYAFFGKDDWKIKPRLTLNIGLRYEYYGAPYLRGGYTTSVVDQGYGLFGAGRSTEQPFDAWLQPGNLFLTGYGPNTTTTPTLTCAKGVTQSPLLPVSTCDPNLLTRIEFVGPDSDLPNKTVIPRDRNNFGPAIGFAWQVPWFGEGKTTVRGGFQVTYGGSGRNAGVAEGLLGNVPGSSSTANLLTSDFPQLVNATRALTLADLPAIVPVRPTNPALPGGQIAVYNRNTAFTAYDPKFSSSYAQNFTLSVTRSLNRSLTLDVRYLGTLGKKREGLLNLNLPNVYYNKELWDALEMTRRGEDAPLFDQMFAGLNVSGGNTAGYAAVGTVGSTGVLQRGSAHLRRNGMFTNNIAIGNFDAVAASLNTLNTVQSGLLSQPGGVSGRVLRNGCDRLAAGMTNIPTRCFPENYIVANPQLSTATYISNLGSSNYHSLQVQFSMRPVQGISFQTTYGWAKTLGLIPQGYTDPLDRDADYTEAYLSVKHDLHTNGTFELPIGPNKLFLGNSSGWLARLTERWQISVIYNAFSGNPRTIIGAHMRYAVGEQTLDRGQNRLNIVSPNFDNQMKGHAVWNGENNDTGLYYGNKFTFVQDPQCALTNKTDSMGFNLYTNGSCTLNALAVRNPDGTPGEIMLQNPLPGGVGNMPLSLRSLGKWRLDMNLGKSFRLTESKTIQVRFDATNLLNHPDLSDSQPQTGQNINDAGLVFGRIPDKGGSLTGSSPRRLQGQLRFTF
jgi:hypothetical protein